MAGKARKQAAEKLPPVSAPEDVPSIGSAERGTGDENLGLIVGQNIKRLRARRGLSLDGLSKASGVSRAMLGQIETGRSVPTINVVWKIARAFAVPFSTLIAVQNADRIRIVPASDSKVLSSANGDFRSRALFPFDGERRTEFYEIHLKAGGVEEADAHASGTMENIVVTQGTLEIEIAGASRKLTAGDAILFQADQPHVYRNPGRGETIAYLVMTYVEPAS